MKRFDALREEFEAAGYAIRAVAAQEGFVEKLASHKDGSVVLGYSVVEDTEFALTDFLRGQGVLLEKTTAKPVLGQWFEKIPGAPRRRPPPITTTTTTTTHINHINHKHTHTSATAGARVAAR